MNGVILVMLLLLVGVGAAMWFGRAILAEHPIRTIAVMFLGAMGTFLGYMTVWLTNTLSGPEWCGKALQAERISSQAFGGLTACVDLLKIQLESLADVLKMSVGSFALGMIVLVVVVLAGSKASLTLPGGIGGNIGSNDPVSEAADKVAGAAVDKAEQVKTDAAIAPKPQPEYNGPGMPEPKGD